MRRYNVIWTEEAVRDLEEIARYIAREQILSVLAVLAVTAVLVITVLLVVTKATVVELDLRLEQVSLIVAPHPESSVELFHSELSAVDLQWKGADRFEATLAAPVAERVEVELNERSTIGLGAAAASGPDAARIARGRLRFAPLAPSLQVAGGEQGQG